MRKHIFFMGLCIGMLMGFPNGVKAQSMIPPEGRYVIAMQTGRAVKNTRIPALVLDSYRGVIWTCQNLQDGKPLWVMVDLAKMGSAPVNRKKFVVRMLEWQDADLRMPAMVMDIEDGIVWTCPNIVDGKATWIETNLNAQLLDTNQ